MFLIDDEQVVRAHRVTWECGAARFFVRRCLDVPALLEDVRAQPARVCGLADLQVIAPNDGAVLRVPYKVRSPFARNDAVPLDVHLSMALSEVLQVNSIGEQLRAHPACRFQRGVQLPLEHGKVAAGNAIGLHLLCVSAEPVVGDLPLARTALEHRLAHFVLPTAQHQLVNERAALHLLGCLPLRLIRAERHSWALQNHELADRLVQPRDTS